ncbi:hypothetical protein FL583_08130 [Cryptosporangium phraense]|uniref:Uncharacterized protein n=1 Tax=Cryptosporangium phraense TaxID=2593070 RepID=A0A545AWH2_9ACTN|nr:hypothetical protein FL583_08130 [Cryptosporangium phraense]
MGRRRRPVPAGPVRRVGRGDLPGRSGRHHVRPAGDVDADPAPPGQAGDNPQLLPMLDGIRVARIGPGRAGHTR